ncbi:hypothetical protein CC86DRAFT_112473 [Ophiobolus disseminans]|uniref:Uncharacterized protein n=1 Tax=Ophiobolus disseminans TaxID=1469910 RepID=A0A6A6ZKH5_9PLEO|nr:hypothetical protein CC86DRAFT_112473 [Ophiobolus disseminans]
MKQLRFNDRPLSAARDLSPCLPPPQNTDNHSTDRSVQLQKTANARRIQGAFKSELRPEEATTCCTCWRHREVLAQHLMWTRVRQRLVGGMHYNTSCLRTTPTSMYTTTRGQMPATKPAQRTASKSVSKSAPRARSTITTTLCIREVCYNWTALSRSSNRLLSTFRSPIHPISVAGIVCILTIYIATLRIFRFSVVGHSSCFANCNHPLQIFQVHFAR